MNSVICIQSIYNEIMLRFKLLNEILYNAQNFYIARVESTLLVSKEYKLTKKTLPVTLM